MNNQENHNFLDAYFRTSLNVDTQKEESMSSFELQSQSPQIHPRHILDFNWCDGDDDIFMLNIFKKAFGVPTQNVDCILQTSTPKGKSNNSIAELDNQCNFDNVGAHSQLKSNDSNHNRDSDFDQFFANNSFDTSTILITECLSVPSSKHVAQILGKKGSKIRALRETTNTYIRSPLPKEEPVFIIKGKREDVVEAVKAIRSASNFFTSLEDEKEISHNAAITSSKGDVIVVKFSIPESYVGLVVGVKGGTIKEIEKQTKAYIQSPTMDSRPIFTITGSPENCEKAINFISRYLALRGVGPGTVKCLSDSEGSSSSKFGYDYFFAWVQIERPHIDLN